MRRLTEILLLAAYISLLLSFANGLQAMRSAVNHDALEKSGTIRGLLETRQTYYYCQAGTYMCDRRRCCYTGWSCCRGGSCCYPNYYCVLASNGVIGCCPNGKRCSGSAKDPNPDPSPTRTTIFSTSTSAKQFTIASTSTSTSTSTLTSTSPSTSTSTPTPTPTSTLTSTSTTTFTTLLGSPTQAVGETIVEVSALDVNITWSENWVQGTSSCSPSVTSKSTTTGGSSFTYIFQYSAVQTYGFYYYLNVVNYNTRWEVFINGVWSQTYYRYSSTNCTYLQSHYQSAGTSTSTSQNLTIVVYGPDSIVTSGAWSFQFNKLLIQGKNTSSTSTTLEGLGTPTGPAVSASGRAQPYPLLIFAGILLTLLYYA